MFPDGSITNAVPFVALEYVTIACTKNKCVVTSQSETLKPTPVHALARMEHVLQCTNVYSVLVAHVVAPARR
jgi:hypothetical protein